MILRRILRFKGSGQPILAVMGLLLFSIFSLALFHKSFVFAAAPPTIITYQGKLLEDGVAVTSTQDMAFLIYDAAAAGSLLYTASGTLVATATISVTPSSGIFSVNLGDTGTNSLTPSIFADNSALFLEVWIEGVKMSPRKRLTAAPYAVSARYLMGVSAATASTSAYIPISSANGNFTFTGNPQTAAVGGGVVYINPAAADANETLFGVALGGSERLRLDEDGDLYVVGSVNVTGTLQVSATTTLNSLVVWGDIIGIATSDLDDVSEIARIAAANVFTAPNTFNATTTFKSGVIVSSTVLTGDVVHLRNNGTTYFVIDKSGQVGIGTSTPTVALTVDGKLLVTNTSTLAGVSLTNLVVTGDTTGISFTDLDDIANVALLNGTQTFTKPNTFSATTTLVTTTVNGQLNVDGGTLFVDSVNNRVGINSSSPQHSFVVSGKSYFTGTTTLVDGLSRIGHYDEGILDFVLLDVGTSTPGGRGGVLRLLGNSTNKPTLVLSDGTDRGVLLEQINGQAALFLGTNNNYGRLQLNDYTDSTFLSFSATSSEDSYILGNFLIGSSTESITTSTFVLNGDDGYVEDLLGVGDSLFVENAIHIGTSSLHLSGAVSGGLISMTNGPLTIDSVNDPLRINTLNNKTILFGSGFSGFNTSSPQFQLGVGGTFGVSSTSTFAGINVSGKLTVNGTVSGISISDLDDGTNVATISGDQTFTGGKTFSATTTLATTTVNNRLSVGTIFNANPTTGRVGVNTTSPQFGLGVGGTAGFSGTTTVSNLLSVSGRITKPVVAATFTSSTILGSASEIAISGDYAYVVSGTGTLSIFDISSPTNPSFVGAFTSTTLITGRATLSVSGKYAYLADGGGNNIIIVDISNPAAPTFVAKTTGFAFSIRAPRILGNLIVGVDVVGNSNPVILDVTNPALPKRVNTFGVGTTDGPSDLAIAGNYAFVTNNASLPTLTVFDISNPQVDVQVGTTTDPVLTRASAIETQGNYAFVVTGRNMLGGAPEYGAFVAVDISNPRSPVVADSITSSTLATLLDGTKLAVSGDYAFVTAYGSDALSIIDISDPSSLDEVATITSSTELLLNGPTGVAASGNYVYVVSEDTASLVVIDVSGSKISHAEIGTARVADLQVLGGTRFDNTVHIRGGLNVGEGGFLLRGDFGIVAPTSSYTATNTLRFSHTALFQSTVTSSQSHAFVFDTRNALTTGTSTYLLSIRNAGTRLFSVATNGDVHASGNLFAASATVGTSTNPGDLAERVDVAPEEFIEAGDVLVVDPEETDRYRRSSSVYAAEVAGVVSTNPTITIGKGKTESTAVMAMVGRVPVKVSAENGPIERGDLLVTASLAGYAMRYDPEHDDGLRTVSIIGVALEPLEQGTGKRMALIRTGWINNRHQTIAQIQNNLIDIAEADGIALARDPQVLDIVAQPNGQIGEVQENLNLNGYHIVNVAALFGKDDRWQIDEDGRFITKVSTSDGSTSLYALQSRETEYIFSGSGELLNGTARVDFDEVTRDIIDPEQPIKVTITLTEQAKGVYVTEKDILGFRVNELENGTSNATFDWLVIARRKLAGEMLAEEAPVEDEPEEERGGQEQGPEQVEFVEEPLAEEARVEEAQEVEAVEPQVEDGQEGDIQEGEVPAQEVEVPELVEEEVLPAEPAPGEEVPAEAAL